MGFGGSNQPSLLYLLTNFPVVNMWKAQRDARNESKRRPVDSNSRDHQPTHPFPVEAPLKTPMNSQGTYCTVQSRHPPVSFYRPISALHGELIFRARECRECVLDSSSTSPQAHRQLVRSTVPSAGACLAVRD